MSSNRLSRQIRGHSFVHNPSLVSMMQDLPSINGWAKLTRLLPSRPLRIRSRAQPSASASCHRPRSPGPGWDRMLPARLHTLTRMFCGRKRGNPSSVVTSKRPGGVSYWGSSVMIVKNMLLTIFVLLCVVPRNGDGASIVIGFADGDRISKVVADGSDESNRRQSIDDEESA